MGKSSEPDTEDEPLTEVVGTLAPPAAATLVRDSTDKMAEVEDELYIDALETVQGLMKFSDIDETAVRPPTEWVLEYGAAKAARMFRLAQMGNMTRKDAPIGIQVAMDLAKSERRARSNSADSGPQKLAVAVVVMEKPAAFFPSIEVDDVEEH